MTVSPVDSGGSNRPVTSGWSSAGTTSPGPSTVCIVAASATTSARGNVEVIRTNRPPSSGARQLDAGREEHGGGLGCEGQRDLDVAPTQHPTAGHRRPVLDHEHLAAAGVDVDHGDHRADRARGVGAHGGVGEDTEAAEGVHPRRGCRAAGGGRRRAGGCRA